MVETFEYHKARTRMQIILPKKLYFGKHFIDIINKNIFGSLKWHLICSLSQSLPNKLDSLGKNSNLIFRRQN